MYLPPPPQSLFLVTLTGLKKEKKVNRLAFIYLLIFGLVSSAQQCVCVCGGGGVPFLSMGLKKGLGSGLKNRVGQMIGNNNFVCVCAQGS